MKKIHLITLTGLLLGAIGGYAYYHYVGCSTGTCPITSNPYISTGYGAVMGYFASGLVKPNES